MVLLILDVLPSLNNAKYFVIDKIDQRMTFCGMISLVTEAVRV